MLKNILALLGDTPSSAAARQYAFRLANRTGAKLAGLAGIDLAFIEAVTPGGFGSSAYRVRMEAELRKRAEELRARLKGDFEAECATHNMPLDWLSFEGDPVDTLAVAAEIRDLIVTGHDTSFHGEAPEKLPEMISKLLAMTPRPVVVCPDSLPPDDGILVAYDGSLASMRALQLFALLDLGANRPIHVTSIDADEATAAHRASGAAMFLRNRGYEVETSAIASDLPPFEILRIQVLDMKIGTIVLGAYGHRGLRSLFFGSTTRALVESPPGALFLYH